MKQFFGIYSTRSGSGVVCYTNKYDYDNDNDNVNLVVPKLGDCKLLRAG